MVLRASIRRCLSLLLPPAETEKTPVNGYVDVFGKSLNDLEDLRQRRAAFENQMFAHLREPEQFLQRPANPEVLFDDNSLNAGLLRCLLE